jgi:hypothetical protein
MSSKHFSSKGANVKLVLKRKPLVRARALALVDDNVETVVKLSYN